MRGYNISSYDWMLGLGFIFGFSFLLAFISEFTIEIFFGYLALFTCFMVWIGYLPLWILIIEILIMTVLAITKLSKR
jgi:hypothetical protein